MQLHPKGLLITFEGTDGAGKSTQIKLLAERLRSLGKTVIVTRCPGSTEYGHQIRKIFLSQSMEDMDPWTQVGLLYADFAQTTKQIITPALERDEIVLCDRYIDSCTVYQGEGRGLGTRSMEALSRLFPVERPDVTLVLTVDTEKALSRQPEKNWAEKAGLEFQNCVKKGFEYLASNEGRFIPIAADGSIPEVSACIDMELRRKVLDEYRGEYYASHLLGL